MPPRRFTLQEAENLLPRLTDVLSRMRTLKAQHDRLERELALVAIKSASNGHDVDIESRQRQAGLQQIAQQINGLIEDIQEIGCEVKGIEEGLVDFRTLLAGREVYLCWKLGEETIDWWHDLDTGFSGRQRLPERLQPPE